jgi:hypothetical protein
MSSRKPARMKRQSGPPRESMSRCEGNVRDLGRKFNAEIEVIHGRCIFYVAWPLNRSGVVRQQRLTVSGIT